MKDAEKRYYMSVALDEARKALPACRPNPPVGCVLVREGKIVAKGYTGPPGEAHAEAAALRNHIGGLENVSVFVTLEPCSFQGRTPSCAQALIARGAKQVFVALIDPHPKNCGAGLSMLRKAGATVETGILEQSVLAFTAPYLTGA